MRNLRATRTPLAIFVAAAAFGWTTLASPSAARADEVSPDGKGIIGGALLGAEVVTIPISLFQVRSGAVYAIGGGLGAVGGGVGGYFIEQASFSNDGRVPVYMLAGGLALIIPTSILILNATAYHPSVEATEDNAPTNAPEANPGAASGSVVVGVPPASSAPATPAPAATPQPGSSTNTVTPAPAGGASTPSAPQSLIDFSTDFYGSSWSMALPVPQVKAMYSLAEQKQYGLPQGTELRLPIFQAQF
jgi:hypothetical protein